MSDEAMDVSAVLEKLSVAVRLQYRSVLQMTVCAAGTRGFQFEPLGRELWAFAEAELAEARRLVEKLVALGGDPPVEVAPFAHADDPAKSVDAIIENEREAITALRDVIPITGQEPRSEALEHMLEHAIMRKQHQVDTLARARGEPE